MALQEEQEARGKRQRLSPVEGRPADSDGSAAAATSSPAAASLPLLPAGDCTPCAPPRRLVLVHDLDETLLIFNSLLSGTWAAAHGLRGDAAAERRLQELGARWEAAILQLCDGRFFYKDLEEYDQTCLADVAPFDDGASLASYDFQTDGFPPSDAPHSPRSPQRHAASVRPVAPPLRAPPPAGPESSSEAAGAAAAGTTVARAAPAAGPAAGLDCPMSRHLDEPSLRRLAYRYRRISLMLKFGLAALGAATQRQEWEALYQETDAVTGGWLSHAGELLAGCSQQLGGDGSLEVVHVAVTSGQLIPSLAKLLLFRLAPHIDCQHVWSSRHCGKRACFERAAWRFGPAATYVALGDGIEEDEAAAALGWPLVRVLLAPAEVYPAATVLAWRPDAATDGPGLPFPQLRVAHVARAAGLRIARPITPQDGAAHGGSAAAVALQGAEGAFTCCI